MNTKPREGDMCNCRVNYSKQMHARKKQLMVAMSRTRLTIGQSHDFEEIIAGCEEQAGQLERTNRELEVFKAERTRTDYEFVNTLV